MNFSFSDKGWFSGSILAYNISCRDCNSKFSLINKVDYNYDILSMPGTYDVVDMTNYIYVQQSKYLFQLDKNRNLVAQISIPTMSIGDVCKQVIVD